MALEWHLDHRTCGTTRALAVDSGSGGAFGTTSMPTADPTTEPTDTPAAEPTPNMQMQLKKWEVVAMAMGNRFSVGVPFGSKIHVCVIIR